jgi:methylthioribose-1-phosphate isomerase
MVEKRVQTLEWKDNSLFLIDQRALPLEENFIRANSLEDCFNAIRDMVVRGAPLIGFTAIWGMALWSRDNSGGSLEDFKKAGDYLKTARPTAVNLAYETDRCLKMGESHFSEQNSFEGLFEKLSEFADREMKILGDDNLQMAKLAEKELTELYGDRKLNLMTLCNTGFLACGPMGTALGVISHMASLGRVEQVYASETRPYMQGIRLTAYELLKENIPHKIVVEGAASYLMREKLVDAIFIGADRIVSNGDTANKIGSSSLAIVAKHYGIPFYVVAPTSSFDLSLENGDGIKIELRDENEILTCKGQRLAPMESHALNPSFDVTEAGLVEAIFCEKGMIKPATRENVVNTVNG